MKLKTSLAICLLAISFAQQNITAAEQRVGPQAVNLDEIEWGPPGGGNGSPLGLRTARQGLDPVTGGVTYYAMFPAGTHFDLHWHSHDEFVVVVQGSVVFQLGMQTHELRAGAYVAIPGGMHHSWDVPDSGEVIILVRRAGPADFHFVTQ